MSLNFVSKTWVYFLLIEYMKIVYIYLLKFINFKQNLQHDHLR